ncbi:RidA family protein [Nocardioides sp. NPDC047086]|uniref:RidA family protein n=1 Tax=Nocardioides sp. NPDC047086 TaxID=3154810 RepID=UPI0033CB35BE
MPIEVVQNPELNAPVGRFSQAVKCRAAGEFLFVAGLTSRAPDGSLVGDGDIELQTVTILENMKKLVETAGGTMSDIVNVTVYTTDMRYFDKVQEVRGRYFFQPLPASAMIEVSKLAAPGMLIEIDAVAAIGQG